MGTGVLSWHTNSGPVCDALHGPFFPRQDHPNVIQPEQIPVATPRPTLAQLQCFIAVCDSGSFNEAAASTGMSQSTLSEAVKTLEKHLGVPLLHRNRQGVTLTTAGARALEHARAALLAVEDFTQSALNPGELTGTVRIVSLRSAAARILPEVLLKLRHDHPNLKIHIMENESQVAAGETMLLQGEADLGLLPHPPSHPLLSRPIYQDEWVAVYSRNRKHKPRTWADYHHQTFLMNGGAPGTIQQIRQVFAEHGVQSPDIQEFQDDTVLLAMSEHDLGITLLPQLAVGHLPDTLEYATLPDTLLRTIGLMVLPRRSSLPALQVVMGMILQAQDSRKA